MSYQENIQPESQVLGSMEIDSDSDGDNWSETEENEDRTLCLFCNNVSNTVELAIKHLKDEHSIDLRQLKGKFQMDQYSYIKMINYIRLHKIPVEVLSSMKGPEWNDEKYLTPLEYESWLSYDFEALEESVLPVVEDSTKPVSIEGFREMKSLVEELNKQMKQKDLLLEQAAEDIAIMQKGFRNLIEKEIVDDTQVDKKLVNCVGSVSLKADESYFSSYSHYGIHHEMLSDEVRTSTYRDALLGNSEFLKGKSVLDVGCGTAILSMFASKAGAETVVAIDNSEIIYHAMEIAKKNNFDNIKFVKGRLEDTELPVDKVDVIVSEWMGYFLIFEGMLDSIIYARNRHLKLGGTMIPNRCNISILGHGDEARHQQYIGFWKNVYEFDMSCMQTEVLREAMIEVSKPEFVLTESSVIADYDLMIVDGNYSNFSYDFNLKVVKNGRLTSFVAYFDIFFDLPNKVFFSTSLKTKPTHWKQVTFFLKDVVDVKENENIAGTIVCKRSTRDLRSLTVKIKVFSKEFNYTLD